jgi:hypothetical protein
MRGMALFSVTGAALIAVAGGVLALVYGGAADRRAIVVSAVIAFVVQLLAFAIVKLAAGKNVIAGWGVGAILRFLVFVIYALVLVKAFGLPSTPALLSMAVFLFLSTLVEPLFLNT